MKPFMMSMAVIVLLLVSAGGYADDAKHEFSYEPYAKVLNAYVDDHGWVDYKGLKANRAELDAFVASLATLPPPVYGSWSEPDKIAFWCNVYNAVTLKRIVDHYPIEKGSILNALRFPENSIRQIGGVWTEIETNVMGRPLTLDQVEHEILRVEFNEPRIHAAIVCAAVSCPPLRNEPFIGEKLDAQLADQSRKFLARLDGFKIDRNRNRVYLSAIFDWFGEDFVKSYTPESAFPGQSKTNRAVLHFVSKHVGENDAEYLRTQRYSVHHFDYDWTLNEQ